jgi:methionyl-tRNA formyltransferase
VKIALLAKPSHESSQLYQYLLGRGHVVWQTDEKVTAKELSRYDIGVSWFYKFILRQPELDAVKLGIANNHIGFLPEGRGANPNIWPIAHRIQAGVTLHYMTAGVDEGPIIARQPIEIEAIDTSKTLYNKLVEAQYNLFLMWWPSIELLGNQGLRAPSFAQEEGAWHTYRVKDTEWFDDLDNRYGDSARLMIDQLRARTFPPYNGCYFRDPKTGKKVFVDVSLRYE